MTRYPAGKHEARVFGILFCSITLMIAGTVAAGSHENSTGYTAGCISQNSINVPIGAMNLEKFPVTEPAVLSETGTFARDMLAFPAKILEGTPGTKDAARMIAIIRQSPVAFATRISPLTSDSTDAYGSGEYSPALASGNQVTVAGNGITVTSGACDGPNNENPLAFIFISLFLTIWIIVGLLLIVWLVQKLRNEN
ncbi:MAG: hypothetical protein LUQ31_02040 [Methanoregula sp.]|nr:hypothetical protein [Methanoregula sp.]